MNIQGLQKLTLLDYPGHTACTVFTGGCNFRCPFCHNSPLVITPEADISFTEDEVFTLLSKRKGILDGVAVTGGEPLIQKDIADFLRKVKDAGFLVKLDTNGMFPDKLKELINDSLVDYVAMDIKNSKEKYAVTSGVKNIDLTKIDKSISLLINSNVDYEFRTTVVKEFHTIDDIENIAIWIKGAKKYFLQSFKDSGAILSDGCSAPDECLIQQMKIKAEAYVNLCETRGI